MGIMIESGITLDTGITIGNMPIPPRPAHTITAMGNAQVETSQVKFGTGAYTSDSLNGFLKVTPYNDFSFGTGDFTIEFWYYPTSFTLNTIPIGFRPAGGNGPYITLIVSTNGSFSYYTQTAYRITSPAGTLTANNTWYAMAAVRYAGSTKLYVNGTQVGSTFVDNGNYLAGACTIAANDSAQTGAQPIRGYMDEIRISNIARYTGNYTPATGPFTNDANTLLLIHCDGTNGSTTFTDDNSQWA